MPSPSSLIFVVIILIWAAYLLQHWIRRREALATARSVDRFSEAMRVLNRRSALPDSEVVAMAIDGEPTRPDAPSVSVKPERISLRAGAFPAAVAPSHTSVPVARAVAPVALPVSSAQVTPTEEVAMEQKSPILQAPVRVGNRVMRILGRINRRMVRGVCLLAAALLLVVTVILSPLGVVPWWSPIVMLVVTAGVLAWLRWSAMKTAGVRRPAAPRSPVRTAAQMGGARRRPLQTPVAPPATDSVMPVHEVYDVAPPVPVVPAAAAPSMPPAAEWDPVAVPRPTYTMKEEAPRPAPAPAPVTPPYAQTPVEDLPFDGMALDIEDDDVLPVYRAG